MEKDFVIFNMDPKKMWASMAFCQPEGEEPFTVSVEYLKDYLKARGIKDGINTEALEALCSYVQYNKHVIVANGKPAINGTDGHYEYAVAIEDKKAKPVVAADGSVDYLNSLEIAMVEEGQIFAVYVPPTQGEFGYNLMAEILKPLPGKNIPALKGKGFTVSEDGKEYKANTAGRIYTENGRIIINPVYTVNGDLGVTEGNIKFNGDVTIEGDVHSGLEIDAKGSVFIKGHVGNCKITAGGNITIGKGIQGKYGCEIKAGGDVAGNFVEHCSINAGGKVYANSLLDCHVEAKDSVIVTSSQGCIVGGNVSAMQLIQAKDIGNEAGVATRITFGEMPSFRRELKELRDREEKVRQDLAVFEKQLIKFGKIDKHNLTKELENTKMQITRAKVILQTEHSELTQQIAALEEQLDHARQSAYVRATGVVYPGVVFHNRTETLVQSQAFKDVCYKAFLNEIHMMAPEELLEE